MGKVFAAAVSLVLVFSLSACTVIKPGVTYPTSGITKTTQDTTSHLMSTTEPSAPLKPPETQPSEPYLTYSPYVVGVTVRDYLGEDYSLYCEMVDSLIRYDGKVSGFESEEHFHRLWSVLLSCFEPAKKICAHYGTTDQPYTYKDGTVQMGLQLERSEHDKTLKAFADRITQALSCVDVDDTEVEIVAKLHMFVSTTMVYAYGFSNMYDSIMSNRGTCAAYAQYLILLLNQAGIECYQAGGYGAGVDHAWVIAKMDGQYYHFDPTWEATSRDWSWFAVGDEIRHKTMVDPSVEGTLKLHGDWDYGAGKWLPPQQCPETFREDTRNGSNPPWLW